VDAGFSSPLLDFFRRGEVAHDIRLLAARGALAPRAHEQLGLLTLLVDDPDPEIARAAEATISAIPRAALEAFLARTDVSSRLREFFASRGIDPAVTPAATADEPLVDTGLASEPQPEVESDEEARNALQRIAAMTPAQRVALAMKGTREERAILIRDQNKIVATAVLSSPKITEPEVESIAKMASVSDEILRIIASTRAWVKSYGVVVGLVKNPKTPVAISMNLLARLVEKDLRMVSQDRNVPDILRITARQKLVIGR
jgi:hypothetical protein